jgi:lipopolysaccharide/colanic/teichoic acid biosynthesis glycosyltransferase
MGLIISRANAGTDDGEALKGEMSLVGPRPIVRDELAHYGSTARYYLATRPGLTGL